MRPTKYGLSSGQLLFVVDAIYFVAKNGLAFCVGYLIGYAIF